MDPNNPYGLGKLTARERWAARLSKLKARARSEGPGAARRIAKQAGRGMASAGRSFAQNAAININSRQQREHWDDLTGAIMGGSYGFSHVQAVNNAVLGRHPGLPRHRSRRGHSTHIHIHMGAAERRKGRRSQESALIDLMEGR